MQKPLFTKEQLTFWIHRFRKTDITNLEQRQRLIDIFVNSVYVFDSHLVITFNYKDGTKTVTLADVEHAKLGSDLKGFGVPCGVFLWDLRIPKGHFVFYKTLCSCIDE